MSGSSKRSGSRQEQREHLAELRAAQQRAARRRSRLVVLVVSVAVLALVVPAAILISGELRTQARVSAAAAGPIEGEQVVDVPSATHVEGDVPESQEVVIEAAAGRLPPVGGDHDPTPQNCGVYTEPIRDENAVHSLEHGAVWVTYRPDLDDGQVQRLRELADGAPYLLVSPYPDLASPVVATAWGVQVQLDSATDERLEPFLARYLQGEQTPEPGALCSGGVGA